MNNPSPDLLAALKCEVLGEASLRTACLLTGNPARKRKIEVMRRLETQTRQRIVDYFHANDMAVPGLYGTVIKGTLLGLLFPLAPWSGIIKNTLAETDHYLGLFHRLEDQAAEEDKALFAYIVAHELAIKRFAELEADNAGELESISPMEALLDESPPTRA